MRNRHTKVRSAFTLVEMILVVGMMAVISLAMVGMVRATHENWQTVSNHSTALLDGQAVTQQMVRILRQAKAVTAVSESADPAGFITFTGVNDTTEEFRLDTTTGELLYGDPNALQVLAAPVSSLVFTCYDVGLQVLTGPFSGENELDDPQDIRTVAFEATFVNPEDGTLAVTLAGKIFIPTSAAVTEPSGGVLFVAADAASLTAQETARKALIESWGYSVSLISDDAAQGVFDAAVADAEVVYVPCNVDGDILGVKLKSTTIGIVNENAKHRNNLRIADSAVVTNVTGIDLVDNTHYITGPFATGVLTVYSASLENYGMDGSVAPGLTNLFDDGGIPTGRPSLGALETGAQLNDGGTAAGRRVQLPWSGQNVNINVLTADGLMIMQRSFEWAAAEDTTPTVLLLVVADSASLTAQEALRKILIESWDYTVNLISDDASQGEFDTAVTDADVAYVSEQVSDTALGTKLTGATIGVVNEDEGLVDDFGMASTSPTPVTLMVASIVDNTHYITSPFNLEDIALSNSGQPFTYFTSGLAAGVEALGNVFSKSSLMVADAGDELLNSATAAGRRVKLPWGSSGFDINALNSDGQTILRRSLEWAAGAGGGGGPAPDTEMYVHDITMAWRKQGPRYYGQATVWVKDENGDDVEAATVSGTWSGSVSGTDSGDTAADGTVMHESLGINGGGTYIFTVDSITKDGFTYNASLDVESSGMIVAP